VISAQQECAKDGKAELPGKDSPAMEVRVFSLGTAKVFPRIGTNLAHERGVSVYRIVYMGPVFRSIPEIQKLAGSTIC
jgi:hypothetical protein